MKHPHFEKYAIFQSGGKQYQAIEGKTVAVEKLFAAEGDEVEFPSLLRKEKEGAIEIGQPFVHIPVRAVVLKHDKERKKIVFKFKRRKSYQKTLGHRQQYTVVRITSV